MYNIKKAAMFGLDARIALAIFGALSVISGAALYSAIQQAKATALVAEAKEIGKAWEEYYLDTGTLLKKRVENDSSNMYFYMLKAIDLVNNPSVKGWKGPYLTNKISDTSGILSSNGQYLYSMQTLVDANTFGGTNNWTNATCKAGEQCYLWIAINQNKSDKLALKIDESIDKSDGADKGSFRWFNEGGSTGYVYFLKYAPILNPND